MSVYWNLKFIFIPSMNTSIDLLFKFDHGMFTLKFSIEIFYIVIKFTLFYCINVLMLS